MVGSVGVPARRSIVDGTFYRSHRSVPLSGSGIKTEVRRKWVGWVSKVGVGRSTGTYVRYVTFKGYGFTKKRSKVVK